MPIPENVEDLHRLSAKNIIYQAICDWIITGVLKPGEKLVDTEVAKRFSVSRTPVREAFQLLEAQKLIQVIPGRATIITEIDKADIEKCYRPLAEIQALAASIACAHLDEEDFARLEQIHTGFVNACLTDRAEEAILLDGQFHELIERGAENEYMEDFSRMLILHIQRIKYHYFHCDRLRKVSMGHHREILDALEARDSKKVQELMRAHWLYVMERCLQDVRADGDHPEALDSQIGLTD